MRALGWGTHALAPLNFRAATYSGVITLRPLLTGRDSAQHGEILREAAVLAERGKLAPFLDPHRFGLSEVEQVYALIEYATASAKALVDVAGR